MYAKYIFTTLALASGLVSATLAAEPIKAVERDLKPRQTSNPGGPVESLSSAADEGTTGVLSIQTDTSASRSIQTDTSVAPTIQTDTVISSITSIVSPTSSGSDTPSSTAESSGSSETSSVATSSSDAGAAYPQETGFALAAAAAAGLAGVVAAL
ncbi:hypothetical protein F5Y11DRAFT_237861 [Daldinia sp. FL1419]|nr:hypothetical protein F5Y11DRAFT_237861 [Daldinia sp. FL1419]